MKGLRFYPACQLKGSLPQLHRCWQKTRDSSIIYTECYFYGTGNSPSATGTIQKNPGGCCTLAFSHVLRDPNVLQYNRALSQVEVFSLLYWAVNKTALFCGGTHFLCIPRLFPLQTFLKNESGRRAVIASACKKCRNMRDPWKEVFQQILQQVLDA